MATYFFGSNDPEDDNNLATKKELLVGQIKKDYEGNYWFSTEQAGMFFLSAKDVKVLEGIVSKSIISRSMFL